MKILPNFTKTIDFAHESFKNRSVKIHTEKWQGVDIQEKPEMATRELLNFSFSVPIMTEDPTALMKDTQANDPWAENHFRERVSGFPLNPGVEWANWPYGKSADRFRENGIFNHTYAERYWPQYAGRFGPVNVPDLDALTEEAEISSPNQGIRYGYGDLDDVISLLAREPNTRQAYLPVWFPEDTGVRHGGRVPCSLGYHFLHRHGYLHISYFLRSCDFVRHFRDDLYLTARLQVWVLEQLRKRSSAWSSVKPGFFNMHIMSFHIFEADWGPLFK